MKESIRNFPAQLTYEPAVENAKRLKKYKRFIVAGMGGSNLTAGILCIANPSLALNSHRNYGLPNLPDDAWKKTLVIVSSYSGNTEEALDAYDAAKQKRLALAVICTGGKLLVRAKEDGIPYVQMPDTGIQPRMAIGYSIRALMKLVRDEDGLAATRALSLDIGGCEEEGKRIAGVLEGHTPLIYASERNGALAYAWKVIFNETGKIPAWQNVFPELNHNEMTGFSAEGGSASGGDAHSKIKSLIEKFYVIFLKDSEDDSRIQQRMDLTAKLYKDRGIKSEFIHVQGTSVWDALFTSLLTAEWAAYYTAEHYGAEPEAVPMVEEFKKLMK